MTQDKLFCGVGDTQTERPKKLPPAFVVFLAVACTVFAGLGDWKVLNNSLGSLPKAFALGTIVCAFLSFLVAADFSNLKKALSYFPVYLLLIAVYTLVTLYIWTTDFSKTASISRGGQKILTDEEMSVIASLERGNRLVKGQVFLWPGAGDWHDLWDEDGTITTV